MKLAIIITVSCIVGLWLIAILIGLIMALVCKNAINKRNHTINILVAQKIDSLSALCNLIVDNHGDISDEIENEIKSFPKDELKKMKTSKRTELKNQLMDCTEKLYTIYDDLQADDNRLFENLKASIDEIDTLYRKQSASFNAEIDSYNYWIKYIPLRPFTTLFRVRLKEKIN